MCAARLFKRSFVEILDRRLKERDPLIQVVLGPRQVGKTTGVRMIAAASKPDFLYVSADDSLQQTADWITEQWQNARQISKSPILVIDEIQKVPHWSEKIKALWDGEKRRKNGTFRLLLLGSSSLSLQKGLEESLTGRFETIHVPHWSYEESHSFFNYSLDDYLLYGGYPESNRFFGDFKRWQTYLKSSIIETVIGKDILQLASVRKPALFRQAFELISAYPAQEISYTKLLGQLQDRGNTDLVKHYIELFEGAFLFTAIHKVSGSAVRQKSSSPKIFPLCPALYSYRLNGKELMDPEVRGRVFEAAVGSELTKLPGELFYWRDTRNAEVDFVYKNGSELWAVEVKSGRRKSARGLQEFQTHYPKAKPLFIHPENFASFSKDPVGFLERF
jgi:predicted AAA+ superfamily ATPase